jgi:nucleotide-binding universal stress UspA family protein
MNSCQLASRSAPDENSTFFNPTDPGDFMLPIQTILHPTDFSERSRLALKLACSLARDYGARLIIVHVVEQPMPAAEGVMMVPLVIDTEPVRKRLEQLRSEHAAVPVEHRLLEGNPATEILGVVRDAKCDLVVMGTHGRSGVGRLLMGSVAEQVVRRASCPVLTVKAPHTHSPAAVSADSKREEVKQ